MAQNASISAVKSRILLIAAACSGIVTTTSSTINGSYEPFGDGQLSAVVVRHAGTTERARLTLSTWRVVRLFHLYRFVARVAAKTDAAELAAIEAAEAVIDALPLHFQQATYLGLRTASLAPLVEQHLPMLDNGAGIVAYGKAEYGAVRYDVRVVTIEE